jgi:hypothetical protein
MGLFAGGRTAYAEAHPVFYPPQSRHPERSASQIALSMSGFRASVGNLIYALGNAQQVLAPPGRFFEARSYR